MKNPTLATMLNIIPGWGYIYLGSKKRIFGILLFAGLVASGVAAFDPLLYTEEYVYSEFRVWDLIALISMFLTVCAFMYDGYQSAIAHNAALKKQKKKK